MTFVVFRREVELQSFSSAIFIPSPIVCILKRFQESWVILRGLPMWQGGGRLYRASECSWPSLLVSRQCSGSVCENYSQDGKEREILQLRGRMFSPHGMGRGDQLSDATLALGTDGAPLGSGWPVPSEWLSSCSVLTCGIFIYLSVCLSISVCLSAYLSIYAFFFFFFFFCTHVT